MPQGVASPVANVVSRGVTPLDTGAGGPDTLSAKGAAGAGAGAGAGEGVGAGTGAGAGAGGVLEPPPHAVSAPLAAAPIDRLRNSTARGFTRPALELPRSLRV